MSFFRFKFTLHPVFAFISALSVIVFGLIEARNPACPYFLAVSALWLILFGYGKQILRIIPAFLLIGGIFGFITYFVYDGDFNGVISMLNRIGCLFIGAAIGMKVKPVDVTRSLSSLRCPRSVTLGMLIATSFVPVLKAEIKRIREAMRTRGAGGIFNPGILYRAFLVPLVTRLVNISDTLSLSVETRGYSLEKNDYTVYKKQSAAISDVLFLMGEIAGGVLTVIL